MVGNVSSHAENIKIVAFLLGDIFNCNQHITIKSIKDRADAMPIIQGVMFPSELKITRDALRKVQNLCRGIKAASYSGYRRKLLSRRPFSEQ